MAGNFSLVQRVEHIRSLCVNKTVLHLGCTNYPYTQDAIENDMLLHFQLAETASELYGFDADKDGLRVLEQNGTTDLFEADLEKLDEVPLNKTFDVIIAGEMIEHLNNPGLFLNGIKRFMHSDSILVVTTINAYCVMRFVMYFLRGRGGENEPVHPDHISYYSYKTLKLVLERHDLKLDDFFFYDIGVEHRAFLPWYYRVVNDVGVRLTPQLADGVVAVAKLK